MTPTPASSDEPGEITHPLRNRDACSDCHAAGGMRPVPADHAGRPDNRCTDCHQPGAKEPALEGYVIAILAVAAPLMLLPVALIWYINIMGTVAFVKDRAKARKARKASTQIKTQNQN